MGADYSKDLPSSWNTPEVHKWKNSAKQAQKSFYLSFGNVGWQEYSYGERPLLLVKICFAIFGANVNADAENIEDAYSEEQKSVAKPIFDKIVDEYNKSPATKFLTRIIFVCCKDEEKEYTVPIFAVDTSNDSDSYNKPHFIDMSCRVYSDWNDWEKNNRMPMLKYCYPENGRYSCDKPCQFDASKEPLLRFETSPACDLINRIGRQVDIVSGIASFSSAGVGVACVFFPVIITFVALPSAVVGVSSALYGTARAVDRLCDKGKHEESLVDLESMTCWLMIVATPLHFGNAAVNSFLANGARNGRVFTESIRVACTVVSVTTMAADSALLTVGIVNLVIKAKHKQLSALDVLQFSISVFFFTHTLIQPKTATGIINKVQKEHIAQYSEQNLQSSDAKAAYQSFLQQNENESMTGRAQIIKTINKIDHAETFFKMAKNSTITIGGRRGNTVIVNGQTRINPNLAAKYRGNEMFTKGAFGESKPFDLTTKGKMQQAFGVKDSNSLKQTTIGGKQIFQNMSGKDSARLSTVLRQKHVDHSPEIITASKAIAEKLNVNNVSDFCAIVEMVANDIGQLEGIAKTQRLSNLMGTGQQQFIDGIKSDVRRANRLTNGKMTFNSELNAAYHYRKHGPEFMCTPEVYFRDIPNQLFHEDNLISQYVAKNGSTVVKNYYHDGKFGAVQLDTVSGKTKIATIFPNVSMAMNMPSAEAMAELLSMSLNSPNPSHFFQDMARFF